MPQTIASRILNDPSYSVRSLSDAIITRPMQYDLLGQLGLFPEIGVRATYVEIEKKDGQLNILPQTMRGGPASKARTTGRNRILVGAGYIRHENQVLADDLQNLPAFGTDDFYESFDAVVQEKMDDVIPKFQQTFEYYRWGALRGDVLDADGTTVLYNCFDIMGESQIDIDFKFGTTASDGTLAAARTMRRTMERQLKGERMTSMIVICSAEFMDKMIEHPKMAKVYEQQQGRPNPLLDDVYDGFVHGGVMYVEHNGVASYVNPDTGDETEMRFIPEGEAIAIPFGTMQTFRAYYAPSTRISDVNMPGQSMYVSTKLLDHDEGIEFRYESAPLFLVQKPRLVLRCHSSN